MSWVYRVKRQDLFHLVRRLNIQVSDNISCDNLRKLVIDFLRNDSNKSNLYSEDFRATKEDSSSKIVMDCKLEFCYKTEDWDTFIERFELYLSVNDLKEEKHVPLLLTKVSADTYKLIKELCVPMLPKTKSFKELVTLMSNHLNPKPSECMERCKFHSVKQEDNESFSDFVVKLKKYSLNCNFHNLEEAIRDRIVCGINDKEAQIELFKEKQLTLDKAIGIGTAWEAAKANSCKSSSLMVRNNTEVLNISKMSDRKQNEGASSKQVNSREMKCFCCGGTNHFASTCKHRNKQCNYCGRKGHLEKICFKKKRASNLTSVKQCSQDTKDPDVEPDEEVNHFNYEFFNINSEPSNAAEPLKVRTKDQDHRKKSPIQEDRPVITAVPLSAVQAAVQQHVMTKPERKESIVSTKSISTQSKCGEGSGAGIGGTSMVASGKSCSMYHGLSGKALQSAQVQRQVERQTTPVAVDETALLKKCIQEHLEEQAKQRLAQARSKSSGKHKEYQDDFLKNVPYMHSHNHSGIFYYPPRTKKYSNKQQEEDLDSS